MYFLTPSGFQPKKPDKTKENLVKTKKKKNLLEKLLTRLLHFAYAQMAGKMLENRSAA